MQSGFHFTITDIQTVTFPLPSRTWPETRTRRFFVSVGDGRITKSTEEVLLDRQSLHWIKQLDGFIVDSSSQVTLKVVENHRFAKDDHFATFVIPYGILRSSQNAVLQSVDNSNKKKSPSREIKVAWCAKADSHDVGEMRSHVQNIKDEAVKVKRNQDFLDKCNTISNQLGFIVSAVDAITEVHPYAKIAWSVISFIPKTISKQIELDQDVLDLLTEIEIALDLAPDEETLRSRCRRSDRHEKTLTRLLDQVNECGLFIQSYVKDAEFGRRLLKHVLGDGKAVVGNFGQVLKKLRDDFLSDVIITVEANIIRLSESVGAVGKDVKEVKEKVDRIDENVKGFGIDAKMQNLPYGQGTDFDPEKRCLPQTRVNILDKISDWVNNPSSTQVLMLFGQAGAGKSSIAHEIAYRFRNLDRLTTSYVFVKGEPSSRECYRFFTTLACNLWHKYPAFRNVLSNVINNNPGVVEMRAYTTLFESLLRDPLKDVPFVGPVLIVIDGLDESEDASGTRPRNTLAFHDFLATRLHELPSNFRILITSRPEPDLWEAFPESSFIHKMDLNDFKGTELNSDLLIYLRTKLNGVKGVTDDHQQQLAKKAEGNFQWAFLACSYIGKPPSGLNSQRCIQRVLHPTATGIALNPLYELYTTILQRFDMADPDICNDFKFVMRQILGAFKPLSVDTLKQFVSPKDDPTKISNIVKNLGSLLSHVTPSESALPVAPLHTSFRDFLSDELRSGDYYVNLDDVHDELALATLRTMEAELKFNICKLNTSYLLNSEVQDLEERVANNISPALSYSCYFWADHLRASRLNADVFKTLQVIMKEQFLYWLEVLSVRGEVLIARQALLLLKGWLDQVEMEEIDALVDDAIVFVRYFGFPIAQSAPHIYLSALPFSPSSSVISKLYTPRFSMLRLQDGVLTKWPALEMTISNIARECVAWSGNDEYIAAAAYSRVYVRSALTGEPVAEMGFDKEVRSISISHDGQFLAICSEKGEIWIWDIMEDEKWDLKGEVAVLAVSFAEDGKRLVLGLRDGTVRVWDLEKEAAGEPFIGHSNLVWAVSFLDQEHIVSRSGFRMVLVWNVKTRERVTRTSVPTGTIHTAVHSHDGYFFDKSRVKSSFDVCSWTEATKEEEIDWEFYDCLTAAFSTDGTLVATSSSDHVHVWHAEDGSLAGGSFSAREVACLAFSADGRRIASGSRDRSLRVWNVQRVDEDGNESNDRQAPRSVAFMPDGERIVVGRQGGSVEVLDASTGQEVARITEGIDEYSNNIVSLNENWIASATGNLHIWTRTGEAVAGPLISIDNNYIRALAFSPGSSDLVAYLTLRGTVCVLSASTGASVGQKKLNTDRSFTGSLAFFPSTQTHLVVGIGWKISVWNRMTDKVAGPFIPHGGEVTALMFSSDERYITSVASDCTLCLWDSSNGKIMRGPVKAREGYAEFSALSLDGRKVAFSGINDYTILVFDVLYKGDSDIVLDKALVLAGHVNFPHHFAFSTDGQYLATPSDDRTIRIWNLRTALKRKHYLIGSASDISEVVNLDECWIDSDGWIGPTNGVDHQPLQRRLFWVPSIHRNGLCRPSNTRVIGGQRETRLDIENFVHGEKWDECWLGQ